MAKKTSRPSRATHPSNTPATPLREGAQLYEINGSSLANGFEFANDEIVVTSSGCPPPIIINIPGFPIPPRLNPRTRRKLEKIASGLADGPKIGASLARAIKLIL
jgi:hypothetical protein